MRHILFAAAAVFLAVSSSALAGPPEDATAVVDKAIDQFNRGDIDAWIAVHQDGAVIVDEFAPYVWGGPGSAQRWVQDYGKDAAAMGITGGHVDYSKPSQAVSQADAAYIVIPTVYSYDQGGKKWAAKSTLTFVMHMVGKEWKIASWTYSGETAKSQ